LSLLVVPLTAEAQPVRKIPRLGYIGDTPGPYVDAFRQGLRERGYIEGETIAIEYRWQEGRHERLPDLVAELVQLRVDVLVPVGTQPSRAAKQATSTIPIVMAQVGDPVGSGLVTSLAKPGGNIQWSGKKLRHRNACRWYDGCPTHPGQGGNHHGIPLA
jgi:putative ABC transport system substrate-binding protein